MTNPTNKSGILVSVPTNQEGAQPRLVTETDGLPTKTISETTNSMMIGAFGELLTGIKRDDITVQFQYDYLNDVDDLRTPVLTGDGTATVSGGLLTTSSVITGTSTVESRKAIHYVPGHTGYIDFTASFSGSGIGQIGGFDDEDGFFIKYDNGTLSFGYRSDGSDTTETVSFEGITHPDGTAVDLSKLNIFRILFGYLGVASPILLIKLGDYKLVHIIDTEGKLETTHVQNPAFPIRSYVEDGMIVKTGSWGGGIIGCEERAIGRAFHFPNNKLVDGAGAGQANMVLSGTNVGTAIIFHNKTSYKSKTNKVIAKLLQYAIYVDPPSSGSGSVAWQLIANATYSGSPTYADIDSNSSIIEYDHTAPTGASVEYSSSGRVILCGNLYYDAGQGASPGIYGNSGAIDAARLGAVATPNDNFCLIFKDRGGNNVTVRWFFDWEELF